MSDEPRNGRWVILRIITPFLLAVLTCLSGINIYIITTIRDDILTNASKVHDLNVRVATIEGNRFTIKDWHIALNDLKNQLPPKWVSIQLKNHEMRLERVEGSAREVRR